MASDHDVERIHTRLDEISSDLSSVNTGLQVMISQSKACRRIVMGNGKDSLDSRVTTLETVSGGRSKGGWIALAAVASIVASFVTIIVTAAVSHLMTHFGS